MTSIKSKTIIIYAVVLIMTSLLLYQYFIDGTYIWHVKQTGNQISVAYVLVVLAVSLVPVSKYIKYILLSMLIVCYSIFTGVLGSLILTAYYIVCIYILGIKYYRFGIAIQLSYGILFFVILKATLSIISPRYLLLNELLTVSVLIASLLIALKFNYLGNLKEVFLQNLRTWDSKILFIILSIITVGLNLATKTYGHDSLWYPSRSNALYFYNGFFSDNGFLGHVHYYPKLWESLTNNVFIEYNFSYGASLTATLFILLTVIVYSLFKTNRFVNTLAIITTPVVVGLSFNLKVDFLLLVFILISFAAIERKRLDLFISGIVLALVVKNLAVVFLIPLLVYHYYLKMKGSKVAVIKNSEKFSYVLVALSFIVCLLFLYRTYLLTGVLVASPDILVYLQELLGLNYQLPTKAYKGGELDFMKPIHKIIFYPESLAHHRFYYNGYIWAASIFVLDATIGIFFPFVLFILYSLTHSTTIMGDGNYFAPLTVILAIMFLRKVDIGKAGYIIIICNISIALIANPNWAVAKVPSTVNICSRVFCSDDKHLTRVAAYHKMENLREIIKDKKKKYFIISQSDKHTVPWLLFHNYNVNHVDEFVIWNRVIHLITLQEYLDNQIDIVIIEKNYKHNVNLSKFILFSEDNKYSIYKKINNNK